MKIFLIAAVIALAILLSESSYAGKGHTTIIANAEPVGGGITADLFLETKPGTGKVFIESKPLTRLDTQISTRFAKEIACSYSEKNCDEIDFFYEIKADVSIVGGPSAGASIAALTVAVLNGIELNESVAVTGTINAGNVIGSVVGIPEKIEGAASDGVKKVLVPKGQNLSAGSNSSIDVYQHAAKLGVEIMEVFTLEEVMKEFTGRTLKPEIAEIEIDETYGSTMTVLSSELCNRTGRLAAQVNLTVEQEERLEAENFSRQGTEATEKGSFYAAASYCFRANVKYGYLNLKARNLTDSGIESGLDELGRKTDDFEKNLGNASGISDIQILALVMDRVDETREHLNQSRSALQEQNRTESILQLAFGIERLESAEVWTRFLGVITENRVSDEMLEEACP